MTNPSHNPNGAPTGKPSAGASSGSTRRKSFAAFLKRPFQSFFTSLKKNGWAWLVAAGTGLAIAAVAPSMMPDPPPPIGTVTPRVVDLNADPATANPAVDEATVAAAISAPGLHDGGVAEPAAELDDDATAEPVTSLADHKKADPLSGYRETELPLASLHIYCVTKDGHSAAGFELINARDTPVLLNDHGACTALATWEHNHSVRAFGPSVRGGRRPFLGEHVLRMRSSGEWESITLNVTLAEAYRMAERLAGNPTR